MDKILCVVAIVAITALCLFAVSQGHNGSILSTGFAIIGGLAGYQIGRASIKS